eukprot:CAMPEP_0201486378 /NCGR_PEP_ID=MMETSP0151_2-20130828/10434_1 /ASSEMBLY_ACC=CAM_ASM_000257 /TAXON_ID=200890 /ORGANISM="Paramoeba atlantica, Strain 621/1 / CCAP 1560/9" /LENGTH=900 /DNA_ID=CAMNT_0047870973 /DNA_START=67 /DNA_END=2769 /DNA_ORIENTATION=+
MNGDSDVETESQTTDSSSSSSDCCDRDSEMMDELSPVLDTESPARRVKVFSCDESSTWVEIGIGQLYLGFLETIGSYCFRVKSEDEPRNVILDCQLQRGEIYERQQDTLLVWCEPTTDKDMALSFAVREGCDWFFKELERFRGGAPLLTNDFLDPKVLKELSVGDLEDSMSPPSPLAPFPSVSLPPVSLENLHEVENFVNETSKNIGYKDSFARAIIDSEDQDNSFVTQLMSAFHECEKRLEEGKFEINEESSPNLGKEELEASLERFFHIFKNLILMNEPSLHEIFFRDDLILDVVGTLEYDPNLKKFPGRIHHREILKNPDLFRQVIPFDDEEVLGKVHQTYRIQYLKETILHRYLDDCTFATLKSLIQMNQIQIVHRLQTNEKFFSQMFNELTHPDTPMEKRKAVLELFHELTITVAKCLDPSERSTFYSDLEKFGLSATFSTCFDHIELCYLSTSILSSIMSSNAPQVRQWIFSDSLLSSSPSIIVQIATLLSDRKKVAHLGDSSTLAPMFEILRMFMDPDSVSSVTEKEDMFRVIYPDTMNLLLKPFDEVNDLSEIECSLLVHICDLLRFCLEAHDLRFRSFALSGQYLVSALSALKCRVNFVLIAAAHLLRAVIGKEDPFYDRHIMQHRLFGGAIQVLLETHARYNVLNSVILELFDFIHRNNRHKLQKHIAQYHREDLQGIDYVPTFQIILSMGADEPSSSLSADMSENSLNSSQQDEEDYFNGSEEDEDSIELDTKESFCFNPPPRPKEEEEDFLMFGANSLKDSLDGLPISSSKIRVSIGSSFSSSRLPSSPRPNFGKIQLHIPSKEEEKEEEGEEAKRKEEQEQEQEQEQEREEEEEEAKQRQQHLGEGAEEASSSDSKTNGKKRDSQDSSRGGDDGQPPSKRPRLTRET